MDLSDVVRYFGTQEKAAAALGITQASVSAWRSGIPVVRQYQIEVVTGGALRAERNKRAETA